MARRRPRRVVIVAFPDVQSLDVTGPAEVFSLADRTAASPGDGYTIELVAPAPQELVTSSGLRLAPHGGIDGCDGPIDTLIVAGGRGVRRACEDVALVGWLRTAATRTRRVCSVCTGAFLLAHAGLLDGRRATTHWSACAALARTHPPVNVEPEPIFVRDGNVYTSAGVTAGIDLALALVEEDRGRDTSLRVARELVLFIRRGGAQAQFSLGLAGQEAQRASLRELQEWMADHLDSDLSVPVLAEQAFMSPRNFARVFTRETGTTPAAYVEQLRLERARTLLETTDLQLAEIARRCGFGTVETLRRGFARRLRVSPSDYRERFAAVSTADNVISIGRALP